MGPFSIGYTIFGLVGCTLSIIELTTRGRYALSTLASALAVVTMIGALAYAAAGETVVLGSMLNPKVFDDAST